MTCQCSISNLPPKIKKVLTGYPVKCYIIRVVADIAQSVERILGKDKVTSSILVISSIIEYILHGRFVS